MILPDGSDTKVANRHSSDEARDAAGFDIATLPGTAAYEARLIAANTQSLSGARPLVNFDDAEYAVNETQRSGEALPPYTPREWPAQAVASGSAWQGRRLPHEGYAIGSDEDAEEDDELLHSLNADDEESLFSIRRRRRGGPFLGKAGTSEERRQQLRKRLFISTFFVFFWGCVLLAILRRHRGPPNDGRRRYRPPPPPPLDAGDASTVSCSGFDVDESRPFVPSWSGADLSVEYRAINSSTTYVPLNGTQTFALVEGPYAMGDVLFSTYESDEEEQEWRNALRVVVEAVYRVHSGQEDDDAFENFADSAICLLRRDGEHSAGRPTTPEEGDDEDDDERPPFDDEGPERSSRMWTKRAPGPKPPGRKAVGMGLGVFTRSADNSTFEADDTAASPLRIRLHIAIPSGIELDLEHVLDMRSTAMSYSVAESLTDVVFGGMTIRNSIGDIALGRISGQRFWLETGGKVEGELEVADSVKVINNIGDVNLDVDLSQSDSVCHGPSCDRREVHIQTIGGDAVLRIIDWRTDARLDLRTETITGHTTIQSHPRFEGSVKMLSTSALANLDWAVREPDLDDPLNEGRTRNITMTKDTDGGVGRVHGTVRWENISPSASPPSADRLSRILCRTQLGSCSVTL